MIKENLERLTKAELCNEHDTTSQALQNTSLEPFNESTHILTVSNGRVYVMKNKNDKNYSRKLEIGDTYRLNKYAQIKLSAPKTNKQGSFSYWTLNGLVYSYDRTIYFSAWDDSNFEAVFSNEKTHISPIAFIDNKVKKLGFEISDVHSHKITFNCAYYIPKRVELISAGIIFTPQKSNIEDLTDVKILNTSLSNLPDNTALSTARADQLLAQANNQVLMSLSGTENEVSRYARAFLIYKERNECKAVFSEGIAEIITPALKN